jgi:DMSO/TMAO reductase YedYZ molybdopterin-dependent catalytic subunit
LPENTVRTKEDSRPGRLLMALLTVFVLAAPARVVAQGVVRAAAPAGGYAPSFELAGGIERPRTFTMEALRQYAPSTLDVVFGNGNAIERGSFVGVPLWALIREAGLKVQPGRKNDVLRKYIVVTGSDGYEAVVALAEILPDFAGQPVLLAYERDGKPLGADQGMARLVVPRDKRGGRYVSNVVRIELRDAE